jgi:hypothetical protein
MGVNDRRAVPAIPVSFMQGASLNIHQLGYNSPRQVLRSGSLFNVLQDSRRQGLNQFYWRISGL